LSKKRKGTETPSNVTLTPQQFLQFQRFLSSKEKDTPTRKSKSQAQAQKAAKDKGQRFLFPLLGPFSLSLLEIQERNQRLVDQEETDIEDSEEPQAKRHRPLDLDEEEQELAEDLGDNANEEGHQSDEEAGLPGAKNAEDQEDSDLTDRGLAADDDDDNFFATNGVCCILILFTTIT
jgi:hypothetical protein